MCDVEIYLRRWKRLNRTVIISPDANFSPCLLPVPAAIFRLVHVPWQLIFGRPSSPLHPQNSWYEWYLQSVSTGFNPLHHLLVTIACTYEPKRKFWPKNCRTSVWFHLGQIFKDVAFWHKSYADSIKFVANGISLQKLIFLQKLILKGTNGLLHKIKRNCWIQKQATNRKFITSDKTLVAITGEGCLKSTFEVAKVP